MNNACSAKNLKGKSGAKKMGVYPAPLSHCSVNLTYDFST